MKKITKDKVYKCLLTAVFICAALTMIYFGNRKSGYHVDELYSYGLANSEYLPFMHFGESGYDVKDWMLEYGAGESLGDLFSNLANDYRILMEADFNFYQSRIYQDYLIAQANSADTTTTTWVSGEDYLHYLAVSPDNTFNYASVYYNQRGDVHPPFFYILLHTVCSLFQGSFSKWYGLAINILFMLLTMWVLYLICKNFCGGRLLALAVLIMYGFSCGFATTAVFIRMYAILTFFVVLSCYLHLKIAENDFQIRKKDCLQLFLITFLGYYTHYYFVIYAIGIAVVFGIWMLYKKQYRQLLKYVATLAIAAIVGICVWPFAVKHVFLGYRGQGAIQSLIAGDFYFLKMKLMLNQIFAAMLGDKWYLLTATVLLLAAAAGIAGNRKFAYGKICLLVLPISFYILAVAQIVPFYTDRYVMCAYPFICLIMLGSIYHSIRIVCTGVRIPAKEEGKQWLQKYQRHLSYGVMTAVVAGVFLLNNCYTNMPGYLYPEGQETFQVPENTDCVFVLPDGDWNESAEESNILAQCRQVGVVYESNLSVLKEGYQYEPGDYLLVYIQKNMDIENVLEKVHDTFETAGLQEVSRTNSGSAVRILLTDK